MLIFGSSRAIHHYNPRILTDSLGLTCYNCGQDGNGSILHYGRLLMIEERYHPQVLIYDITSGFDLLAGDNRKYLGWLKAYYDRNGIKEIFTSVDEKEQWKMLSSMYRYNSKFIQIVSDFIHPIQSLGYQGFRPLEGRMNTMKIGRTEEKATQYTFDELKLIYLKKFIDLCHKNTLLVFVVSPMWYGIPPEELYPIRNICKQEKIIFLDYSNDSKYVHNNEYFKDGAHLNAKGADEFTRDLIQGLKQLDVLN